MSNMPYEEAAEPIQVEAWRCKTCQKTHWNERYARECCIRYDQYVTHGRPCTQCAVGRCRRSYLQCDACDKQERRKEERKRWQVELARAVPWDGKAPLYSDTLGRYYFYGVEEILEDVSNESSAEHSECDPKNQLSSMQIMICKSDDGPYFSMEDLLGPSMPEDVYGDSSPPDCTEIDKIVNDWIKAHAPYSWHPWRAATIESLLPKSVEP